MFKIELDGALKEEWKLPLITDYIKKWAAITPDNIALIGAESGVEYTFSELDEAITLYALSLKDLGIKKGDVVVAQWLSFVEFHILTYACATVGAIMSPVDIRLQTNEIVRDMNKVTPKAFFCLGNTPIRDFREISEAVKKEVPSLEHIIQYTPGAPSEDCTDGVESFRELFSDERLKKLAADSSMT